MAEYYPLLAKAIAGLPNSTPESRRAVYDRAQKALTAQLRSLDPPIPESDVARETDALARAVARLEGELARKNNQASAPQAAAVPQPAATTIKPSLTQTPPPPPRFAPQPNSVAASAKDQAAASKIPPLTAPSRAPLTAQRSPAPATGVTPAPAAGLGTLSGATKPGSLFTASAAKFATGQKIATPGVQDTRPSSLNGAMKMPPKPLQRPAPPPLPAVEEEEHEDEHEHEQGHGQHFEARARLPHDEETHEEDEFDTFEEPRVEAVRLYAPQPDEEDKRSRFRLWLVGTIVGVVVAIVAVAAWTLRDRPDELAKLKPVAQTQADQGGKIAERVGGNGQSDDAPMSPNDAASPNGATNSVAPAPAPAPADQTQTTAAAANQPANAGSTAPGVAVTYRAALLVEAPEEASKVKTYLGTVVWRLDNVSGGTGQTVSTAVHADVDIPGDKLKASFTFQKNTDPSLAASHTMMIDFMPAPDSPSGGVKQITVVQMRVDNTPRGDALVGVPVPVMDNSFIIGLTGGAAEVTNITMIKTRPWFDIPMRLVSGKIAKLTFEKGSSGARDIDDALASWQIPQQ